MASLLEQPCIKKPEERKGALPHAISWQFQGPRGKERIRDLTGDKEGDRAWLERGDVGSHGESKQLVSRKEK